MIVGERVRQAREIRRITQVELARAIGVNQSAISHIENGSTEEPSNVVLENIVLRTSFPVSFFKQRVEANFVPGGSLLLRARRSLTLRERNVAYQWARVIFEALQKLEKHIQTIPVNLPPVQEDPTLAARNTRVVFGIPPDVPIGNLIDKLERNGIIVLALPLGIEKLDAFCAWGGDGGERPVIIVSSGKPTDRLRLSVSHELGHLLLHKGTKGVSPHAGDDEAFAFAAEFLLPEETMRKEIVPPVSLYSLAKLKPKWKVSIQALIRRARDLKIITQRQYSYLMTQMSARGWRKTEPSNLDIPEEKPRAFSQIAELLYGKPIDYKKMAHDLCLPLSLVKSTLEEHAGISAAKNIKGNDDSGRVFRLQSRENEAS